jgi:hypothetical protein
MAINKHIRNILLIFISIIVFTGCSSKENNGQTFDEQIVQSYLDNNRIDKYNDLKERYDNIRLILWYNQEGDAWWITNFTMWVVFSILPDLPDLMASSTILVFMWWIGMFGGGGLILGGLATIGALLGGIPGIPPAIMGIVYLGLMFSILSKLFGIYF